MKPNLAIVREMRWDNGLKLLWIDTKKAMYRDINWKDLGSFGKYKFETLLMLKYAPTEIKAIYV